MVMRAPGPMDLLIDRLEEARDKLKGESLLMKGAVTMTAGEMNTIVIALNLMQIVRAAAR